MKSAKKVYSGTVLIVGLILFAFLVPCQAGTNAEQRDASQSMELEQITVTAQKTETSVQDVPASVSVFDGLALEDMQVDSLDDVSVITPNIGIDRPDNHTTYLVYRGMGGMINMNKIFNVNIDGVTIPYVALANFLDLERVEVLRGSQGCLYGRIPIPVLSISSLVGQVIFLRVMSGQNTAVMTAGNFSQVLVVQFLTE